MDDERIYNTLVENGIVELGDSGDAVALTESFRRKMARQEVRLRQATEDQGRETVPADFPDELREWAGSPGDHEYRFLAGYRTVDEYTTGLSTAQLIQATTVLDQLLPSFPPVKGTPAAFLPIHGDRLGHLLYLHPRSVVYVWLEDCPPCEAMKENFDKLLSDQEQVDSSGVSFFSVYGPDWARVLSRDFDVEAGPATLFVIDGEVDSRIYGATHVETLEYEVEFLASN